MCRRALKRTDAAPRISVSVELRGDQLTLDKRGLNSILHQEWPMAQRDGCLPAKLPVSVPSSADSSIVLLRAEDTQRAAAMGHLPSDSEGKYTHTCLGLEVPFSTSSVLIYKGCDPRTTLWVVRTHPHDEGDGLCSGRWGGWCSESALRGWSAHLPALRSRVCAKLHL